VTRYLVNATWDDAPHLSEAQKASLWASIPEHERDARVKGIPVLGSGRVFPVIEDDISVEGFPIPAYWARIIGVDFGWDHPFAAVDLAMDWDRDVIYVTKSYRKREAAPLVHATALRPWGRWIPIAWPRDGRRETLEGAGLALAKQFKEHGLNMLGTHAQFSDGSVSVEAGLMDMLDRMETGRFKVFRHLNDWWEEFRLFHRKDGKVVKEGDDLMAATRYGVMMIREALVDPSMRSGARRAPKPSDPLAAVRV
jgi:hypothetical protein